MIAGRCRIVGGLLMRYPKKRKQKIKLRMENIENRFGEFFITTDKTKLDVVAIHDFLSKHSGWSDNIPFDKVKISIENSLNFGLFHNDEQIGFARIISDFSTIAYLGDVYVLEKYRGQGLSKKLMESVMTHPYLQELKHWILLTLTAEALYKKYGFTKLLKPELYMERLDPLPIRIPTG
jgi:N-acetylglutamate synthase-like GNAT family acetyltransferase